jgi:hypothetical protein
MLWSGKSAMAVTVVTFIVLQVHASAALGFLVSSWLLSDEDNQSLHEALEY